jgi:hypothetical protein
MISKLRTAKDYMIFEAACLRRSEANSRTLSHQLTAADRLHDAQYHAGKAEGYRDSAERLEKLAASVTEETPKQQKDRQLAKYLTRGNG